VRKELAIRTAMGGGWRRLMRERLMESLLLSVGGGALGLVLAAAALAWLERASHAAQGAATLEVGLAVILLIGVMSYVAAQRTNEIGIRIALGAQRERVMQKMLLDGMRPAVFGLVAGLAASLEAGRLMRNLLYEIKPLDPAVFAVVTATLLAVAVFACIVPAWRASRLDPMQALRTE
jgi:ABC-type antimicrobial peptide transport system permease subunit